VPEIVEAFSITEGAFGAIYAGCTVTASIIMLSVGHMVDHKSVKKRYCDKKQTICYFFYMNYVALLKWNNS
jgi:hypothetical protein